MNQPVKLDWPTPTTDVDASKMRAALERLAVAVASSNGLAEPIDPEESGADVPPALKDLADEMAVGVHGAGVLLKWRLLSSRA